MTIKSEPTHTVRIYLSGPIEVAKQACREFCMVGLCVTIKPTLFIYTGGEESGYVVGLVNYPRFPATPENIEQRAADLARTLLAKTFQHSALIMTPEKTTWITTRE